MEPGTRFLRRSLRALLPALAGLLAGVCGCAGDAGDQTTQRLRSLARVYFDHIAATGRGPRTLDEFERHLGRLEPFAITGDDTTPDTDLLFYSDRDGEPFVIRYGLAGTDISAMRSTPIAYESAGRDGERLVVYLSGDVERLDEATGRERGVFE